MPLILRKVRRGRWDPLAAGPWLGDGEASADALGDLQTAGNALSVWEVDPERSNLDRVAGALAASADYLSNVDYALLDERVLLGIGIRVAPSPGDTPDDEANAAWHRDLVELSASRLAALGNLMASAGEFGRVLNRRAARLIEHGVASGHIERGRVKPHVLEKLFLP